MRLGQPQRIRQRVRFTRAPPRGDGRGPHAGVIGTGRLLGGRQGLLAAGGGVMTRCHTITAIPHLRRSGRLPCGHRRQKRGVAPCQVRDAYLVTAGLIELLAELVAVAVVEDSLEHLVAGGLER